MWKENNKHVRKDFWHWNGFLLTLKWVSFDIEMGLFWHWNGSLLTLTCVLSCILQDDLRREYTVSFGLFNKSFFTCLSKETHFNVKRDPFQCQKRPISMSKKTNFNVKRKPFQCRKESMSMSKESHINIKRNPFQCQKRLLYMWKETYIRDQKKLCTFLHESSWKMSRESHINVKRDPHTRQKRLVYTWKETYIRGQKKLCTFLNESSWKMSRESHINVKRDHINVKRELYIYDSNFKNFLKKRIAHTSTRAHTHTHTHTHTHIYLASVYFPCESCWQKRPISMPKETYIRVKRDLYRKQYKRASSEKLHERHKC